MRIKVTRKEVAKMANVSEATVSFVLNDRKDISISAGTRQRVLQAIDTLGYHPNHAARTMAGKKSHTLGVLTPWNTDTWFFAEMLEGIRNTASQNGYGIVLCGNILKNQHVPEDCIRYFWEGRIEGVIYLDSTSMVLEGFHNLKEEGIPVALCNGIDPAGETDEIVVDYAHGIYKASEYIYNSGFHKLIYILPDDEKHIVQFDMERLSGFKNFCHSAKAEYNTEIISLLLSSKDRMSRAEEILRKYSSPVGIVACYWQMAYYLKMAAEKKGLCNGKDIKIVAGDKPFMFADLHNDIEGIKLPFYELGGQTAQALIKRLEGRSRTIIKRRIEGKYDFINNITGS